ncbi:hypothetical protein WME89_12865 [Sorangium sp. So ce321]|uniref:hypothetical protein n=1 Tax=Sorangium sp. So ce321 TaxID=3133300 RepID=UPI003F611B0E
MREQLEKLVDQANRLATHRRHLPEATVIKYYGLCFWYAELLLGRVHEDEDALLELDWPLEDAPPCLVLRRRARVIDLVPFLRARKTGQ